MSKVKFTHSSTPQVHEIRAQYYCEKVEDYKLYIYFKIVVT